MSSARAPLSDVSAVCGNVAYHGTPNIEAVLADGLRADKSDGMPCVWLALRLEDARYFGRFGGVVEIDLTQLEGSWPSGDDGSPCWQAHYGADIPPEALRHVT